MERSLKVRITNNTTGESTDFNGCNAFGAYAPITAATMAGMSKTEYDNRVTAFKLYLEALIPGLNFNEQTVVPNYRQNTVACPVGNVVS
jgi:hypothetical protein